MADSMRLFVGGLHETVTSTDLQQRFGRFGSVTSVDIRTKRDCQGQIVNVFGYIDIIISDTNFKKCLSTYNDAKWKGCTMKVQVAKEDFLTRLAKERKEARENPEPLKPAVTKTRKMKEQDAAKARLEDNMKKAGVEDFLMKKAVPGTPIPGETNWIVAKFGRVLPIMHMQRKDKRSQVTYDPSKYVHYLRKFKDDAKSDQDMSDSPVEDLTWHLPEATSDIDRKRMGDFPDNAIKKKVKAKNQGTVVKDDELKRAGLQSWENSDEKPSCGKKLLLSKEDFEIISLKHGRASGNHNTNLVKLKPYSAQIQDSRRAVQKQDKLGRPHDVEDLLEQCKLESDEDSCGSADTDDICNFAKKTPRPDAKEPEARMDWAEEYYTKERMAAMSGDTEDFHGFRKGDAGADLQDFSLNASLPNDKNTGSEMRMSERRTGSVPPGTSKEANGQLREALGEDAGDSKDSDSSDSGSDAEDNDAEIEETDDTDEDNSEAEEEDMKKLADNMNSKDNNEIHKNKSKKEGFEARTRNKESVDEGDDEEKDSSSDDDNNSDSNDDRQSSDEENASDTHSKASSDSTEENKTPQNTASVGNGDSDPARRTTFDSAGDQSKHKMSDKIRLESVKKRQATILTQKAAVQEALKSVDLKGGPVSAKMHVRFDSDDEVSEAESMPRDKAATSKAETTSTRQPGLFDSDDEEEMKTDDEERFKIKPQFQGKAGEKLLKLQDRIGMDSRFKLGEMFMEDDGSDDGMRGEEDRDLKAEKQKSLSILEGIVGSQAMHNVKNKTTSNFRDPSRVRYDPTKADHAHFEVADTSISNGSLSKKKDKAMDDTTLPEVSKDTYYEVADLAFSQGEKEGKLFSFFGGDEPVEDDKNDDRKAFSSFQKDLQASTALGKKQLMLDSSDSESEEEEVKHDGKDEVDKTPAGTTTGDRPTSGYRPFFFQPDDIRLKTGPEQFCRKLSLDGMNQWFEEQKAELQGEYKKRHQRALRDSKKAAQQGNKKPRR